MRKAHRSLVILLAAVVLAHPPLACALNFNETAVKGLSQAYGFIIGQEHTLDRVSREYPDLAPSALLARARFASTFPDIQSRLEAELRSALGPENFGQLSKKTAGTLREAANRQAVTPDVAAAFLDQVEARARGEIESPVLESLLAVKYKDNPAREYSDGFRQRFDTDGTGKARGIRLSLRLPRSWAAREGERPHIVKKWTTEGGTGREILMLDIRDADGYDRDKREIERFLRSGEVRQVVPQGGVLIASGPFTVEGRPGYWVDMKLTEERVGVTVYHSKSSARCGTWRRLRPDGPPGSYRGCADDTARAGGGSGRASRRFASRTGRCIPRRFIGTKLMVLAGGK